MSSKEGGQMTRNAIIAIAVTALACNSAPAALQVSITPGSPTTSDDLAAEISGELVDPDGDEVAWDHTWYLDGQARPDLTELTVPAELTAKGQSWKLFVLPSDGRVDGPPSEASVVVLNTPPVVTEVALTPADPQEADTINAAASAEDADGDAYVFHYTWTVDRAVALEGSQSWLDGEHFDKGQEVSVSVSASDGDDQGESLEAIPVTVRNTAPSVEGAVVDPQEIYEASTVSCLGQGWQDDDGDAEGYQIVWYVDDAALALTSATLTGEHFDKGQRVGCSLVPDDGEALGDEERADAVEVLNTAPRIDTPVLSETAPTTTTQLAVSVEGTDDDGDPVTMGYAWFVDEEQVSDSEALDASLFVKHQDIRVEVTPSDRSDSGLTVSSATARSVNTPPVLGVTLSHSAPLTDDIVTANTSVSDDDGDEVTLSYAWTVSATAVAETGSSLDGGTYFDKGDSVAATVTADDGDGGVVTGSDGPVTVLNSPPTAPVLAIDPEEPEAEVDDLLCSIVTEAVDADGDPITYTLSWEVDGVAFTGSTTTTITGDTVLGGDTQDDDVWTCSVVPNDGTDDGEPGAASVTTEFIVQPDISCSAYHCCSLDRYGTLQCWGKDTSGQCSHPTGFFVGVGLGDNHSCAIEGSGDVVCWGSDSNGQASPPTGSFTAVSAGYAHSCGIESSGEVQCWGASSLDRLTAPAGPLEQIAVGHSHTCGVTDTGSILCWGEDDAGQATPPTGTYTQVAAGSVHSCAVDTSGLLACWGSDYFHQASPPSGTFDAVEAGALTSCGIDTSGQVHCWGSNNWGQATPPSGTFMALSVGGNHACGIETSGTIQCWGKDDYGQSTPP
jgi:hypothetical protein